MRLLNTVVAVIFVVCTIAVGAYWLNRIITMPDAGQLATKTDIAGLKNSVEWRGAHDEAIEMNSRSAILSRIKNAEAQVDANRRRIEKFMRQKK